MNDKKHQPCEVCGRFGPFGVKKFGENKYRWYCNEHKDVPEADPFHRATWEAVEKKKVGKQNDTSP